MEMKWLPKYCANVHQTIKEHSVKSKLKTYQCSLSLFLSQFIHEYLLVSSHPSKTLLVRQLWDLLSDRSKSILFWFRLQGSATEYLIPLRMIWRTVTSRGRSVSHTAGTSCTLTNVRPIPYKTHEVREIIIAMNVISWFCKPNHL